MNQAPTSKKDLRILAIILLLAATLTLAALLLAAPDNLKETTVVPAGYAMDHGAESWDETTWEAFNTSPANRWILTDAEIWTRAGRGPAEWLPPLEQCLYQSRFDMTLEQFDLDSDAAEDAQRALQRQRCYTQFQ